MVRKGNYAWEFAETIANCMQQMLHSNNPASPEKAEALGLAIDAAHRQNRFAAMRTCESMITSISDDDLANHVRPILLDRRQTFVKAIEPTNCQNDIIAHTLREIATAKA